MLTATSLGISDMLSRLESWITFLPRITIRNVLEIIILALLIYGIMTWIKDTRAWNLFMGIIVILIFTLVCAILHLDTIVWIIQNVATIAVVAIIIIFQPELRKALEQLGSGSLLSGILTGDERSSSAFTDKTASEIARAAFDMAKVKTGALIVIERDSSLKEIEDTGIPVDAVVTSQLLINIFEKNTPLHDGAVLIRGNRVVAATCYLPLSDNTSINKQFGTRHRAAVGISEVTDSLTVVVSEETGQVSLAQSGELTAVPNMEVLRGELLKLTRKEENTPQGRLLSWKGRKKNEGKAD